MNWAASQLCLLRNLSTSSKSSIITNKDTSLYDHIPNRSGDATSFGDHPSRSILSCLDIEPSRWWRSLYSQCDSDHVLRRRRSLLRSSRRQSCLETLRGQDSFAAEQIARPRDPTSWPREPSLAKRSSLPGCGARAFRRAIRDQFSRLTLERAGDSDSSECVRRPNATQTPSLP